jgi:hypothetical protein
MISIRVDNLAALKMLHSEASADVAVEHSTAPAGVALLSAPGAALTRYRGPSTLPGGCPSNRPRPAS